MSGGGLAGQPLFSLFLVEGAIVVFLSLLVFLPEVKKNMTGLRDKSGWCAVIIIIWHLFTTGGPGEKGLAALPGREAEFRRILATSIDYAKALNCKM